MKDIHFCITLSVGMTENEVQKCAEFLEETFHEYIINNIPMGDHIYSTAGKTMFRHVVEEMLRPENYNWHEKWNDMPK